MPLLIVLAWVASLREADIYPTGPAVTLAQAPIYPVVALKARMEGFAMVEVWIGEDGAVLEVWSQGNNPLLAAAGRRAAEAWRFTSGTGAGVRCATLLFRFTLRPGGTVDAVQEVTSDSPHSMTVSTEPYPSVVTTIYDPLQSRPCLVTTEPWSTTFCERALAILPLQ